MRTALVSDLHIGSRREKDLLRLPAIRARLVEALAETDRLVLLGDTLELRELPVSEVLRRARPVLRDLSKAMAGKPVLLVPGNHDHHLAAPFLERMALDGASPSLEAQWALGPRTPGVAGALTRSMPDVELAVAYPGLRLREDVYATHGHYLDPHMTVPTTECVSGALLARLVGRRPGEPRAVADYEAALTPLYALAHALAQGVAPAAGRIRRGDTVAVEVWRRANSEQGRRGVAGFLLARVAIPAGVALLNRLGLGPYRSELSAAALRRSAVHGMAAVVRSLGVEADHVIFGHSHRAGPLPGEEAEWRMPGGPRLTNTGTWVYEPALLGGEGAGNPYWPGTLAVLGDSGPPELVNLLGDLGTGDLRG